MKNRVNLHNIAFVILLCLCLASIGAFTLMMFSPMRSVAAEEAHSDSYYKSDVNSTAATSTIIYFDNGEGSSNTPNITVNLNESLPNVEIPHWDGKKFVGYYTADGETQYYDENGIGVREWDINKRVVKLYAKWEDINEECIVIFEFEGGISESEYVDGKIGEILPSGETAPQKAGYVFKGYYQYPDGQGKQYYDENMVGVWELDYSGDADDFDGIILIYAKWDAAEYQVTFDNQGGESGFIYKSVAVIYQQNMPYKEWFAAPTREGYKFLGYFGDPVNKKIKYYDAEMQSVGKWEIADDGVVYAHWEALTYTVYLINPECSDNGDMVRAVFGQPMPQRESLADIKRGYDFMGYYSERDGKGEKYYNADMTSAKVWDIAKEDTELYAYWKLTEYTINYLTSVWMGSDFENPNPSTYTVNDTKNSEIIFKSIEIDGVTIKWSPSKIPAESSGNIDVKMITVKLLDSNTKSYNVNLCNSEIIFLSQDAASYCSVTVAANVESVMIVGHENVEYNMNIVVHSSAENFLLALQNVIMKAGNKTDAIKTDANKTLLLSTTGTVGIYGGNGIDIKGSRAIFCGTLYIHSADSLIIQGGRGGRGAYASQGRMGGEAVYVAKNAVYVNCDNVTIRGGTGGTGGNYDINGESFDENGKLVFGPGVGGIGGYPFAGTDQRITIYKKTESLNLIYENGENGEGGKFINQSGPDYPYIPPDPIYPVDPPIYIS